MRPWWSRAAARAARWLVSCWRCADADYGPWCLDWTCELCDDEITAYNAPGARRTQDVSSTGAKGAQRPGPARLRSGP